LNVNLDHFEVSSTHPPLCPDIQVVKLLLTQSFEHERSMFNGIAVKVYVIAEAQQTDIIFIPSYRFFAA